MQDSLQVATIHKVLQSNAYTAFVLQIGEKTATIYTEPKVGQNIQCLLSSQPPERPYTHTLITHLFRGFDIQPRQVLLYDVDNRYIFHTRLLLERTANDERIVVEIEARPSDTLTLALLAKIPIRCHPQLFAKL